MECLIGVHRRSSAANKGLENSRPITQHRYWPPMNADERRCPDSLTEQVLGAIFEVSNTLGPGFLEKVYERALLRELTPTPRRQGPSRLERAPLSAISQARISYTPRVDQVRRFTAR